LTCGATKRGLSAQKRKGQSTRYEGELSTCREAGCDRPAPDDRFCSRCERAIWFLVLSRLLAHPPPEFVVLRGVDEADVAVLVSENESLRRRLAKKR
jgi:hypothetical protein